MVGNGQGSGQRHLGVISLLRGHVGMVVDNLLLGINFFSLRAELTAAALRMSTSFLRSLLLLSPDASFVHGKEVRLGTISLAETQSCRNVRWGIWRKGK